MKFVIRNITRLGLLKNYPDFSTDPNINFYQLFKLACLLDEAEIPYEIHHSFKGFQLRYPSDSKDHFRCSVILHAGSYGREDGLLEIMGLLTDEELKHDPVLGYLNAEEVFNRIKADYNKEDEIE